MPPLAQPPPLARPIAAAATGAFLGWAMGGGSGAAVGGVAGLALASMAPPQANRGALTSERSRIYRRAMGSQTVTPDTLDRLAAAFDREHLDAHATMLRRRARALRLTPAQSADRRLYFARGLASAKPAAVAKLSESYRAEGALLAARELTAHAADLRAVAAGKVDAACVARLEQRLAVVSSILGPDTSQAAGATANLEAARAALAAKETP